jgi:hypothetical protein
MHVTHMFVPYAGPVSYASWLQGNLAMFGTTFLRSVLLVSRLKARFEDVSNLQGRSLPAVSLFYKGLGSFSLTVLSRRTPRKVVNVSGSKA